MNYHNQKTVLGNPLPPSPPLAARRARTSTLCATPSRFSVWSLCAGLLLLLLCATTASADQDPPGCTGSGLGIILYTDAADVHIGDTLEYSVLIFNGSATGPIVCDATSIQAFVVTPDGISHTIALTNTSLVSGQANYYSNVVSYVCRAQDIQPNQTVDATASDTGVIHQNINNSQGGGNQGVNTQVSLPCVLLTMQCVGGVGQNAPITFSGIITNCGNDTLVDVTVTNFDDSGHQTQVAFVTNLLAGQAAPYSGSWIPANSCNPSTVTLVVQAVDQFTTHPRTVTSSITNTCSETLSQGIVVTKNCPPTPVSAGQLLTFSGSVSNTGDVALTNIIVLNNQPSPNTTVFTLATLAAGATANFTGSYTAPGSCSVSDTLTASATSACGVAVNAAVSATCPILTTPQIAVTQNCPVNPVTEGDLLIYSGTVSNEGNVTITNVVVVNDQSGATPILTVASLPPGAATNFTGSYVAPAACSSTSTSTATGQSICGVAVTNAASTTCPITTASLIAVTQNCPANPALPGGLLTYSGTVSNAGTILLTNVVVVNNRSGTTPIFTMASMAPGAVASFSGSYVAPANCSDPSTSTATAQNICGLIITGSASTTCPITTTPGLAVTEVCPLSPGIPGQLLTYSGTVSNAGNITLTNIIVVNNLSGSTPVFTTETLAPGAVANFTGSYLAPSNCFSASTATATASSICGVSVTNAASATCPIGTFPLLAVTENCPAGPVDPGSLLIYSGTVSNAGDITLTNVVVLNDHSGASPIFTAAVLPPGAISNFTGSYVAPAACSSTSTSTATGESTCGVAVTNAASATCPITSVSLIAITQTCPANPALPGGLLTYSGTVSNAGNILLTNVVVVNNRSGSTPIFTAASMAPGAVASFTGSYVAPANCSDPSTSTATAENICGLIVTSAASTTCPIGTTPGLAVTEVCPFSPAIPGQLLTYSGTVSNAGNITLTNIVVLNNLSGSTPVFTTETLAPGAVANFTGSYLAPSNCFSASTATATAGSTCGISVTNSASATCPITTVPVLAVTENCPAGPVAAGSLLTYSGTVRNAGDITLTNVVVLNDQSGSAPVFTAVEMPPGAISNFTGSYVAPADVCSSTSTSTATGQGACGLSVTNAASATCPILTTPLIAVTQVCPANPTVPGGLVNYSGTVSNAGNIMLANVVVLNSLSGSAPIFTASSLAPGAVSNFTGSYVAPADCSIPSTATATGQSPCGVSVTNSATTICPITTSPLISVTMACPVSPASSRGLVVYSGTVSNAGNILLTNVVVLNDLSGSTPVFTKATLPPGTVASFTGSYVATTDCSSTSTATATAGSICGIPVTSSTTTTCPILTSPAIVVTQFCPSTAVLPGDILTYTGTVSNAGNILLTNIIVVDNQPASNTVIFTLAALAPGATTNFSGSYQVPLNCCTVWSTVEASGQGCAGAPVTNEATRACNVLTEPALVVSKVCPPGPLQPGALLTYSGTVSNAGDIALTGVTVVDSEPYHNSPVLGPITLAPGQIVTYTGSYIVPPDFCGGDIVTASGLDACGFVTASNSVMTPCPITTSPSISVYKNCPLLPTARGGLYTYTGSVSNSGNVTLVRIFVVDNEPSNDAPVLGPVTLSPGASALFTNSYTAPYCCCSILDVLTASGLDDCSSSNVTATAAADCSLLSTPSIAVSEQCPSATVPVGGLFEFTGSVTNIGDVVLTNVFVYSSLPVSNTVVLGPLQLAPGQSEQFSSSFIVAAGEEGLTVTASGLDTCQGTQTTASVNCSGTVLTNSVLPAAGIYNGLFFTPGGIQNDSSGYFTFTLKASGTYTASLLSVGKHYSTSGKLNSQGQATNNLVRPGASAISVNWQVLPDGSGSMSGTVSDGAWASELTGYRSVFNSRTNPAPQIGRYTLIIPGTPGADDVPEGDGYGVLTVNGNGLVVFAGTLADGTKAAQSVSISKSGQWPFYVSLYSGSGSILGWLQFANITNSDVSGQLNWIRPSIKTSKLYPAGFGMASAAVGSLYVAPVGPGTRVLGLTNGMDILSGGNLSENSTNAVTLGLSSKVVNAGSNKLTLTFALPSGLFTGTLVEAGTTRHISYSGVVLQKANYGSGYFLGTNQSGSVIFSAAP